METNWHTWSTKWGLPKQKKNLNNTSVHQRKCLLYRWKETKRGMEKERQREEGQLIWVCLYKYSNIAQTNINPFSATISWILKCLGATCAFTCFCLWCQAVWKQRKFWTEFFDFKGLKVSIFATTSGKGQQCIYNLEKMNRDKNWAHFQKKSKNWRSNTDERTVTLVNIRLQTNLEPALHKI